MTWSANTADRYYNTSTDQSTRSASLTSIVDMYQRPLTASGTYPPFHSQGPFYYDYSEEFDPQRASHEELSPDFSTLKRNMSFDTPEKINGIEAYRQSETEDQLSDLSCESYLQGSHDDSIQEIEEVIANAIAKVSVKEGIPETVRPKTMPRPGLGICQATNDNTKPLVHSKSEVEATYKGQTARQRP